MAMLITGFPVIGMVDSNAEFFLSIYRIVFGLLLALRIYRSKKAYVLIHSNKNRTQFLFKIKLLCTFFIIFGLFTPVFSVATFVLFVLIFYNSNYFSIEEIYFQNVLFFLPFLGTNKMYSFDSFFNLELFLFSENMLNAFLISNSIILLSAGYEKLKSPIWIEGIAAKRFLTLPHLVNKKFQFIGNIKRPFVWKLLTYLILFCEFFFIISIMHYEVFMLTLIILLGFAISLFSIVDLSFIGQILGLNLILFVLIFSMNTIEYKNFFEPRLTEIDIYLVISIIVNIYSLMIVFFYNNSSFYNYNRFLTGIICPIAVFNERHLSGFYIYKLKIEDKDLNLEGAFSDDGYPDRLQKWHPRIFQSAMYFVTDFCLGILKFGFKSDLHKQRIVDLLYSALDQKNMSQGKVSLSVRGFNFEDTFFSFSKKKWNEIVICNFKSHTDYVFEVIKMPDRLKEQTRSI